MSAVNEWVVREYFELLGYFVSQPRKYSVPGRHKRADEEVDLVVINPRVAVHCLPENIIWNTEDMGTVARAVVKVRGWHSERFYASTFEQAPEILRFVEEESTRYAAGLLGADDIATIICLPRLPASGDLKEKTIDFLREKGVHGVIAFSTMLNEIIQRVDVNRNYDKSDLLQIIRLLKNYEMIRNPQMEFFEMIRRG